MRDFMTVAKALSDENRVRMLMALSGGELCVCQITELVGLSPSTVSKHLSILRQARLVEGRKDGRWMYYRYPGSDVSDLVRTSLHWLHDSLTEDPFILADAKHLKDVLKLDPEKLCRQQSLTLHSSPRQPSAQAGVRKRRGRNALKRAG
jgi:DNA-binding transcriptional ArsR family regulator